MDLDSLCLLDNMLVVSHEVTCLCNSGHLDLNKFHDYFKHDADFMIGPMGIIECWKVSHVPYIVISRCLQKLMK